MPSSIPHQNGRDRVAKAFSLVELLAVIGILGVLSALLLPILPQMMGKARRAEAQSNLRQAFTAIQIFASDNDGRIVPSLSKIYGDKHGWSGEMRWPEILISEGYIDVQRTANASKNIFGNPVMRNYYENQGANLATGETWARNAYIGEGSNGETDGQVTRFQSLSEPSKTALLMEGAIQPNMSYFFTRRFAYYKSPNTPNAVPPDDFQDGLSHVLFCDGHVQLLPHADIPSDAWQSQPQSSIDPWIFWKGQRKQ